MNVPALKPFSWSYSKIKNFETCPKRHYHVDIIKDFKEDEGEALQWGFALHDAFAKYLGKGMPLGPPMKQYQKMLDTVIAMGGERLVEQKLAIDQNFAACGYFAKGAWFRGVADVLVLMDDKALALDWKTGKVVDDSQQLALMAQCVFSHYPKITEVTTAFVWLKDMAKTPAKFTREDMPAVWNALLPRVKQLEHAHNTTSYPAKPGFLCRRYCPVTSCPHNGR